MAPVTVLTEITAEERSESSAGLVAVAATRLIDAGSENQVPVLVEVGPARRRAATVLSTGTAKDLEARLRQLDPAATVVARGRICLIQIEADETAAARIAAVTGEVGTSFPVAVACPPGCYHQILESLAGRSDAVVFVVPRGGGAGRSALLDLARAEAGEVVGSVDVVGDPPGRLAGRSALAGVRAGPPSGSGSPRPGWRGRLRERLAGERGQATPLTLGAVFVLVAATVALVAIAGAITGKGRAQRAADLSALSAARSMKDDLPRLMAPPTLPSGLPNPAHMSKAAYLARARFTAVRIATSNGASPASVSVRFPDGLSFAPVTARVSIRTSSEARSSRPVWAVARIGASASAAAVPAVATGGGYSGPLAERQGHGMRPDVAAAFDRLISAARAAGSTVVVNSGFRSDEEQAALFAANPDPTWVAPPGKSLHRCATELDLGPPSAYGWLAGNASRFGFARRYSWEPWHFGFTGRPAPCSTAGNRAGSAADRGRFLVSSVPGFVPRRFRQAILAAAMKWGVSATLLSAQLMAESNFNPTAVSSAGARGIAQFMPGTAAAYGLRDPFDPEASIDAQAHLMSDLLRQFGGKPALALAAYNAGPGAVAPCDCVPDYPETRAYVTRILALLGGAASAVALPMEIELVA